MKNLSQSIRELSGGTEEEVEQIQQNLTPRRLQKGEFLLEAGAVCQRYYFVESGALRLYYFREDQDYTVWIATPGQIFTDLESYLHQQPGRIYIEALEPSDIYLIEKGKSDALAQQLNVYNTLLRRTVEIAFVGLSKNVMAFQSEPANERYQRIEREKDWLLRFPLRYISSFIGVTQSSLSRIRSRRS